MIDDLRTLPGATWSCAVPRAIIAAPLIAIPADLIDTRFFGRPIDPKSIDYLILAVTAGLIGLILAIRPATESARDETNQTRTVWGGFVSFLAVGRPVCN